MADSDSPETSRAGGRREAYRLTDRERNYILNGDSGTDRPSRLMSNIRTKRNRLPERFRELFLDIEYLEPGGYFEPQEWETQWKRLMGVSSAGSVDREFVQFGRKLGIMTRRLNLYPENSLESDVWAGLIFGFIDGLCFHNWDDHPRHRNQFMESLLEKITRRSESDFDDRASEEEEWFSQWKGRQQVADESAQKITEILESEGIDRPRSIALSVCSILRNGTDELEPKKITSDKVMDTVETHELVRRRDLRIMILNDIEELESYSWDDLSSLEFLEHAPHPLEPASSRDIANELGSPQEYLSKVVKLGLFLMGEEQIDGEVWDGLPVIESVGSEDTYGNREWILTDYGKALRAIYLDQSHSFRSLEGKEFTQEHFDHALMDRKVRERLDQ